MKSLVIPIELVPPKAGLEFACALSEHSLLCYGELDHQFAASDIITLNGEQAVKPYLGTSIIHQERKKIFFILTFAQPLPQVHFDTVAISHGKRNIYWKSARSIDLKRNSETVEFFLALFSATHLKRLFYLLINFLQGQPTAARSPVLCRIAHSIRMHLPETGARTTFACWPLPGLLVAEMIGLPENLNAPQLVLQTQHFILVAPISLNALPPGNNGHFQLALAWLEKIPPEQLALAKISILASGQLIPLEGILPNEPISGLSALLERQENYSDVQRLLIREQVAQALIARPASSNGVGAKQAIYYLQHFVAIPHKSLANPHYPLGVNVEHAIAVDNEGFLLSGWLRDPQHLLEDIRAVTDMGFVLSLKEHLHFQERPYVDVFYENSPTAAARGKWGFIGFIPVPGNIQRQMQAIGELYTLRFEVFLKGSVKYIITPPAPPVSAAARRATLIKQVVPHVKEDPALEQILFPLLEKFHREGLEGAAIQDKAVFGKAARINEVSLIIPAGDLELIKAQCASLAQDPQLRRCEIIYVTSSNGAENTLRESFKSLAALYKLSLTLMITKEDYGDAAAINLAVQQAKAPYLLLLSPYSLPKAKGWLQAMVKAYEKAGKKMGAMAPKLVYYDQSIAHAGMQMRYENANYQPSFLHRGYPSQHPGAQQNRPITAVSSHCMLVRKNIFTACGGFNTAYISDHGAAVDFCLMLLEKGYKNRYCADLELFLLEPLAKSDDLAKDALEAYDLALCNARWKKKLKKLLEPYAA